MSQVFGTFSLVQVQGFCRILPDFRGDEQPSLLLKVLMAKDFRLVQQALVKYSEQSVYRPLEEIKYWFAYSSGAFIEPGYPPLFYNKDKNKPISPNISAVASVGEGVAGFIAQRLYKCRKLARPNHDFPDIVMEDNSCTKTYLVESKATISSKVISDPSEVKEKIKDRVDEELPRIAAYASSCLLLDNRPIVGILVGTALLRETNYFCYVVEINL